MQRIYITTLDNYSLQDLLKETFLTQETLHTLEIHPLPLQTIRYLRPSFNPAQTDLLIFTSKNAPHSLEHHKIPYHSLPCLTLSPATAKVVRKLGGNVVFNGTAGNAESFVAEILHFLAHSNFLSTHTSPLNAIWFSGEKTAYPLNTALNTALKPHNIHTTQKVAYKTEPIPHSASIPQNSLVIFTAPSMLEAYLDSSLSREITPIAIGPTTQQAFLKHSLKPPLLSPKPSLAHCLEFALQIRNSKENLTKN